MNSLRAVGGTALLALALGAGCAGTTLGDELRSGRAVPRATPVASSLDSIRLPSEDLVALRHRIELIRPDTGPYVPIERSAVALDVSHRRIYATTSRGDVFAFDASARRLFRKHFDAAIDAAPAVDTDRGLVFVATSDGFVRALDGRTGEVRLESDAGHPFVASPVVTEDTVYCVSDTDVVVAISREDGAVLWTYRRPPAEEIRITGHAGLLLHAGAVIGAFNDGVVAAVRASDGAVLWEIDTSVDLPTTAAGVPRMRDVDTTPVLVGQTFVVASFAAGVYVLDARNGTVLTRDETWTGVTSILPLQDGDLVLASASRGVARVHGDDNTVIWERNDVRGAPAALGYVPEIDAVVISETAGSLRFVEATTGFEVGRVESGYGFGAGIAVAEGLISALSNAASLYLLETRPLPLSQ